MLAEHPVLVVFLVAVAAPLIAQTRLGSRLPVVVFEVLPGIAIGPHVLKLIDDPGLLRFMYSALASLGSVVVIGNVGLKSSHLGPDIATALIGAALVSLLVYPTAARVRLARAEQGTALSPSIGP
jgi:hypothetical protein